MSRKPPPFPDSLRSQKFAATAAGSSYAIDVITPLFGGGVDAGVNDPDTLIRGTAIRGHLRFWWRATRGARFGKSEELAEAEGKIWGTPKEASRVEVSVNLLSFGSPEPCEPLIKRERHLGYALFPFRETKAKYTPSARFSLNLRYPEEVALDVKAAIWGWVNFGGIGARTRRGCGALFCKEMAPTSASQMTEWLKSHWAAFGLGSRSMRPWPTLAGFFIDAHAYTTEKAWSKTISLLYRFRQGDIARGPAEGGKAGRTRWPEVNSLRAIARRGSAAASTMGNSQGDPAFPRARLGLPIIFHFIDSDEEIELSLAWKESTRMASPLILRPLLLRDGVKALATIVRLRALGPPALKFTLGTRKEGGKKKEFGPFQGKPALLRPDLGADPNSPLHGSKEGSALIAFLELAQKEGFTEVG